MLGAWSAKGRTAEGISATTGLPAPAGEHRFTLREVEETMMNLFRPRSSTAAKVDTPAAVKPNPTVQRRKHSSLGQYFAEEIPIIVPCFNNLTYVKSMVSQLKNIGSQNIVLVDNNSEFPPMIEYLAHPEDGVRTVLLKENLGPRNAVVDTFNFQMLPDIFCVTDPDLEFNKAMPDNFLAQLLYASQQLKCGKVGLALEISDHEHMVQDDFLIGRPKKIWEHEAQFWVHQIYEMPGSDPVFTAEVDTTFALYNKAYFTPTPLPMFLRAVRVGGNFTCRHLPWYRDNRLPPEEEAFYRSTARDSFYLKREFSQKTRDE